MCISPKCYFTYKRNSMVRKTFFSFTNMCFHKWKWFGNFFRLKKKEIFPDSSHFYTKQCCLGTKKNLMYDSERKIYHRDHADLWEELFMLWWFQGFQPLISKHKFVNRQFFLLPYSLYYKKVLYLLLRLCCILYSRGSSNQEGLVFTTEIRYLQLSGAVPSNSILEMKIAGLGCSHFLKSSVAA